MGKDTTVKRLPMELNDGNGSYIRYRTAGRCGHRPLQTLQQGA